MSGSPVAGDVIDRRGDHSTYPALLESRGARAALLIVIVGITWLVCHTWLLTGSSGAGLWDGYAVFCWIMLTTSGGFVGMSAAILVRARRHGPCADFLVTSALPAIPGLALVLVIAVSQATGRNSIADALVLVVIPLSSHLLPFAIILQWVGVITMEVHRPLAIPAHTVGTVNSALGLFYLHTFARVGA